MPRELGDVLHYFLDEAGEAPDGEVCASVEARALPTIAVPLGERDVVRAAFVWNLAVELARAGTRPLLLAPEDASLEPLRECFGQAGAGKADVVADRDPARLEEAGVGASDPAHQPLLPWPRFGKKAASVRCVETRLPESTADIIFRLLVFRFREDDLGIATFDQPPLEEKCRLVAAT